MSVRLYDQIWKEGKNRERIFYRTSLAYSIFMPSRFRPLVVRLQADLIMRAPSVAGGEENMPLGQVL